MPTEPQLATRQDFAQIVTSLPTFWGNRDVRHLHHPTAIEEFADSAFVIRDPDRRVAAYLFGMIVAARRLGYVHVIATREDQRGRGHARQLYGAFAELAAVRGCVALKAITTPANHASIAFHESLGMRAKEIPDYAEPGQSRVVLTRELRSAHADGAAPIAGVTIVSATSQDINRILDFWRIAAEDSDRPSDRREAVEALVNRDPDAILLAVLDGRIVACVIAGWDGWRAHLYRLSVHPDHRRQGLGHWLLSAAEGRLAQLGAIRFDAMVHDHNQLGRPAWAASGYAPQVSWTRWVKPVNRPI